METLIVFEAGIRNEDGQYHKFMDSPNREEVQEYLEIMKETKPEDSTLVFMEKTYKLVCTTPYIVSA